MEKETETSRLNEILQDLVALRRASAAEADRKPDAGRKSPSDR